MGKRKRGSPEVLRRAYGDEVGTLRETVLSLLPQPLPSPYLCSCEGRGCFGCMGEPYLLRTDDDPEYRRLLFGAYCFVPPNAPRPSWIQYSSHSTQLTFHTPNEELLCSSAWNCFLNRIGDSIMNFLLNNSAIFVPLASKNYYRVTGVSVANVYQKCTFESKTNFRQDEFRGSPKDDSFSSLCGKKLTNDFLKRCQFYRNSQKTIVKAKQENASDKVSRSFAAIDNCQIQSLKSHPESKKYVDEPPSIDNSGENLINNVGDHTKKRVRLFSWQRRKRLRKLNGSFKSSLRLSRSNAQENKLLIRRSPPHFCPGRGDQMTPNCFSCLISKTLPKVSLNTQIKREYMLYSPHTTYSVFPRNHILNRLKPNNFGALSLMKHIFGMSEGVATDFLSCSDKSGVCSYVNGLQMNRKTKRYPSLLKVLKILIRNAHRCQHFTLLNRHCCLPLPRNHHKAKKSTVDAFPGDLNNVSFFEKTHKKYVHLQHSVIYPSLENTFGAKNINSLVGKPCFIGSTSRSSKIDSNTSYCDHQQVVSFIWAVCRSIVPVELLGDSPNWRALRKNISKFVCLRRYEKITLRQAINGLKISRYSFLSKYLCCSCNLNIKSELVQDFESDQQSGGQRNVTDRFLWCWINWFFSYMIVPILGSNFYVTERESGKQNIFYYVKPVWRKLVSQAISSLKEQNYSRLDINAVKEILSKRSFGYSKVRFLPKENGVRLLANLKRPSKAFFPAQASFAARTAFINHKQLNNGCKRNVTNYKSVNSALCHLHAILRRIRLTHSDHWGSSVFDYNDVHRVLIPFLSTLRNRAGFSDSMPKLYIVVSDVSKAFDSIDQDKLLDIMSNILQQNDYHFKQCTQVICTKRSLLAINNPVWCEKSRNQDIGKMAEAIRLCSSRGVLMLDASADKKRGELLRLLHDHLKSNVVRLDCEFYLQKIGIPQGSSLSALLCSLYLGHMERHVIIPFLQKLEGENNISNNSIKQGATFFSDSSTLLLAEDRSECHHHSEHLKEMSSCLASIEFSPTVMEDRKDRRGSKIFGRTCDNGIKKEKTPFQKYVLLRWIDDFLFISTSEKLANRFFSRLQRGFREYNCFMNTEKFGLNFDVGRQSQFISPRTYAGKDGISFLPWSGLLINCQTLEIQADYTRYWGVHMNSTLTVSAHHKVGSQLQSKLCDYMRPKCYPIFYDSNINSLATVSLNAYQAFLICAMKFHCYMRTLSNITLSPIYCKEIVEASFSYMYKLIKKRMYAAKHYENMQPLLRLKRNEFVWLGLSAYVRVLKRKEALYRELLSLLRSRLDVASKVDCIPCHLRYAVDESHSSLLWKIKY